MQNFLGGELSTRTAQLYLEQATLVQQHLAPIGMFPEYTITFSQSLIDADFLLLG